MPLVELVRAAWRCDLGAYLPFYCDGHAIGHIRRADLPALARFPGSFEVSADRVSFALHLSDKQSRDAALIGVCEALMQSGHIAGWRNELYRVCDRFGGTALFDIERCAARFFGLTTYAAHLNGYVREGDKLWLWIGRRSDRKAIDPGLRDNLVAGGISAGLTPFVALVKEANEEAGMPASLARRAVPAGLVRLRRDAPEGLHSEIVFVFDLQLDRGFVPVNQDGEVSEFTLMPVARVLDEIAAGSSFTLDAGLVTADFLVRRGLIAHDAADYVELVAGLRGAQA